MHNQNNIVVGWSNGCFPQWQQLLCVCNLAYTTRKHRRVGYVQGKMIKKNLNLNSKHFEYLGHDLIIDNSQ